MKMDMYDRIEDLISSIGMTKKELAHKAEVPYSTLTSAFGRRSTSFSLAYIQRIASTLDVTADYLINGIKEVKGVIVSTRIDKKELTESLNKLDDVIEKGKRIKITKIVKMLNELSIEKLGAIEQMTKIIGDLSPKDE